MVKKYVLDTNVILADPLAFTKFGDNEVILPITVIEELDNHKTDMRQTGQNARHFFKYLDKYIDSESIKKGVVINATGGILRVDVRYTIDAHNVDLPLDYSNMDNRIINCAYINDATIVSNDRACRVKASAYGIITEIYKNDRVDVDDQYTGWGEIWVESDVIDTIYKDKIIPSGVVEGAYPNQFFILKDMYNEKHSALVSYNDILKEFTLLVTDQPIMGIQARNMEQHFALSALCDPEIRIVTLIGKAGCGKSLVALAAGLHGVTQGKDYKKLLVYRPIVPMGNDIGYLPGSQEEKLGPWMQAISDNIDFIMGDINAEDRPKIKKPRAGNNKNDIPVLDSKGEKSAGKISPTQELVQWGLLSLDATTYIRGRSIPDQYLIVDEAQNLTPHEIKTIVTRAGEGTKIILTGDPSQIDAPYLDATNNGLSYVAEKSKTFYRAATIKFSKSERSELAEWAANNL